MIHFITGAPLHSSLWTAQSPYLSPSLASLPIFSIFSVYSLTVFSDCITVWLDSRWNQPCVAWIPKQYSLVQWFLVYFILWTCCGEGGFSGLIFIHSSLSEEIFSLCLLYILSHFCCSMFVYILFPIMHSSNQKILKGSEGDLNMMTCQKTPCIIHYSTYHIVF